MESATKFLQKWRVRLGHLFAIVVLIFARPTDIKVLLAGTAVALAGEAIRIASAGYIPATSLKPGMSSSRTRVTP